MDRRTLLQAMAFGALSLAVTTSFITTAPAFADKGSDDGGNSRGGSDHDGGSHGSDHDGGSHRSDHDGGSHRSDHGGRSHGSDDSGHHSAGDDSRSRSAANGEWRRGRGSDDPPGDDRRARLADGAKSGRTACGTAKDCRED